VKNTGLIIFLLSIFLFVTGRIATAQTYSCQQFFALQASRPRCLASWPPLDFSTVAPTAVCCNPGGIPFGETCIALSSSCAPPNAAAETCIACNRSQTATASEPVDLATGNTFIEQADVSVPGLGGGLLLARTWNSLLPNLQSSYPFMFGSRWRSNYEERLVLSSPDGYLKYLRADGSVWSYGVSSADAQARYSAAAPGNDTTGGAWAYTAGNPNWTLSFKKGEKRVFDSSTGALLSITDRNGNATTLSYDSGGRLTTVTDPASRHLYFNYANGSTPLVSSVTSDLGITVSYAYDTQGRLTLLTKADGTTVSFEYNNQSLITAVRDSSGKVLEAHTYDAAGRGLTSSRANGVGSVSLTYSQ
jgi:YD repeat-containing protein